MLTISITIESELNAKLDETGMFLKEETQKKLDDLMVDLEKQLTVAGLSTTEINYDFYDDEENDTDILSEGITVTEVSRGDNETLGWNTREESEKEEVEEEGRKYKKN